MQESQSKKSYKAEDTALYILGAIALVIVLALTTGRAHAQSGNVYSASQGQSVGYAQEGIIVQVAYKKVEPSTNAKYGGAGIGAVLGGLIGANQNLDWRLQPAAGTVGATLGGLAGDKIVSLAYTKEAQELVIAVRDENSKKYNRVITVVQPEPFDHLEPKDKVIVVSNGGAYRVIKVDLDSLQR